MDMNMFKRKIEEVLGQADRNDLQSKLYTAMFLLKKGNIDELTNLLNSVDKNFVIDKIYEIDKNMLKKYNINTNELKKRLSESDFDKIRLIVGPRGNEVVTRLKQLLNW